MGKAIKSDAVLHLISSLKVGGAERLLVSTMQAAKDDTTQRYVVVVMNDQVDEGLFRELKDAGHPVYRLERPQGHLHPRYLAKLIAIIREHGVGIIHTHNDGSLAWGMAAKLACHWLKLVYTQHAESGAREFHGMRRRAYQSLVDMTVAISPFVALETHELSGGRVTLVENGICLDRFRATARPMAMAEPTRLVSVARFAPVKGQDILIRAVRRCLDLNQDVRCTLVGTIADRDFYETLKALITDLNLEDRVAIALDRTDVEMFLGEADIFVLPSREEGFGIAIIEAMAAGLPVVVSATGGAKDLVTDGFNGLHFKPGDDSHLAMSLLLMASDERLRRSCAHAGQETATRYDIRRALKTVNRMYGELLSRGDTRARDEALAMVEVDFATGLRLHPRSRSGAQGVETSAASETPSSERATA